MFSTNRMAALHCATRTLFRLLFTISAALPGKQGRASSRPVHACKSRANPHARHGHAHVARRGRASSGLRYRVSSEYVLHRPSCTSFLVCQLSKRPNIRTRFQYPLQVWRIHTCSPHVWHEHESTPPSHSSGHQHRLHSTFLCKHVSIYVQCSACGRLCICLQAPPAHMWAGARTEEFVNHPFPRVLRMQ